MTFAIEVRANGSRIALIHAEKAEVEDAADVYDVSVALGPDEANPPTHFGLVASCRGCGTPGLIKTLVDAVMGEDGVCS